MADLVGGRYPSQNPAWSQFGMLNNLAQPDVPAYTNAPPGGVLPVMTDGAPILTKEETTFPLWVPWGVSIEKFSLVSGATETETLTHAWIAVRTGVAPAIGGELKTVLVGESADTTGFEAAKVTTNSISLKKALLITPENAPNGYVYVSIFMAATKVGTYASFTIPPTALTKASSGLKVFPWFAGMPMNFKSKPASATTPEKENKECVNVFTIPFVLVQ